MVENVKYPYRRFLIFSAVRLAVVLALPASYSYLCHSYTTALVCIVYYLYQYTNTVSVFMCEIYHVPIFHTIQYIIYLHYNILYIVIFLLPLLSIRYMLCIYPLFTYLYYYMYIHIILSIPYVISILSYSFSTLLYTVLTLLSVIFYVQSFIYFIVSMVYTR